jgi:hypothetical protein
VTAPSSTPRRTWALYGFVVPEGRILAGAWFEVLAGPIDGDAAPPPVWATAGPPLLGTWDHRPTDAERRAVLPPEGLDDGLVLDDQCPITGHACDRPCGDACLRGQEPPPLRDHREPGDPPWTAAELLDGLPADEGACPDDPDGLHHSGCGCPDVDPLNP